MRMLLRIAVIPILLIVGVLGLFLLEAHWEMRQIKPTLPTANQIEAAVSSEDGPVSIRYINTASQASPGRHIIHPSYAIEWPDGRILLIDAGMDESGARTFGATMERFLSADPIEFHGSAAQQLGPASARVEGIGFTHLHVDHTGGIGELCNDDEPAIAVFQTEDQAVRTNYTTTPGQTHIHDADCTNVSVLKDGPVHRLEGFPGLIAIAAGGHTPGSTVFVARVKESVWVLAGDITLALDHVRTNTPKPAIYSSLIVPEAMERMEELRLWLRDLERTQSYRIIISHDIQSLHASEMKKF